MWGGGPQHITASNSQTLCWYWRIQFHSDTIHLGIASDSADHRFSPTRLLPALHLPLQTPVSSSRMLPMFLTNHLQIRCPGDLLLRFNSFARVAHWAQGNKFTDLLKDMIKETDQEPDEELDRVRYRKRVYHPPHIFTCSPTQKLSKPSPFGFLMEASLHSHD